MNLLNAIQRIDLQEDDRFKDNNSRMKNLEALAPILQEELLKKTSNEWIKIFDEKGLPCGPINSITEMHNDPHTLDRKMVIEVDNKKAGKSKAIGMPIKFSDTNANTEIGAPNFGQHTDEILVQFGYSAEQIKDYKDKGIVA